METTATPQVTLEESKLRPELHDAVRDLLPAIRVFYYHEETSRLTEWFIVEREGRVGTVSLHSFYRLGGEHSVSFCIKPSREYGSSLAVRADDWNEGMPLREAVLIATQPAYGNPWATNNRDLPNDGMRHFDWMKDRMREVVL